jgi:hypothetical protein
MRAEIRELGLPAVVEKKSGSCQFIAALFGNPVVETPSSGSDEEL